MLLPTGAWAQDADPEAASRLKLAEMGFMIGEWQVDAKIRTPSGYLEGSGTMDVRFDQDGTMLADMNIPFDNFTVAGTTERVYDAQRGIWDVAWMAANGQNVLGIAGRLKNGRFIEIDYGSDRNGAYIGRLVISDITDDHFLVRKDQLYDDGTLRPEIWVYEATRTGGSPASVDRG